MFAVRCLSHRLLPRFRAAYPIRSLSAGAASPQVQSEQYQSTVNLIKEDLQLIQRDILQVSTRRTDNALRHSFRFALFFLSRSMSTASSSLASDDSYESVGLVKPEVNVYVIPPRQSTTRKHRAADWKLDSPNFVCRLKIISKGEKCLVRLEDRNTGAHFATCPIESYPSIAVENVEDSTRYFVIRVQNENGQQAFLGIGFGDRSDSFDFNVALQDHFKYLKQTKQIRDEEKAAADQPPAERNQPKLDLSFKEGQTIKINLKSSLTGEEHARKSNKASNEHFTAGILPPPPGSSAPKPIPPPAKPNTHSESSWMQF